MTPLLQGCTASKKTARTEIRRIWINWILFILLGVVAFISLSSFIPSLHQFVTNPRAGTLNETQIKIEPGLGESETLFSLAITCGFIGAFIGSLAAGFLTRLIPYWHLNLSSLVSLTVGWSIYAVAVRGWMLLLARFLIGFFIGMHFVLTYAYFGESFEDYVAAQKELDNYGERQAAMKDILFALHGIALYIGYIIAFGVPALFTLFDISQFRSIAWFNVALAVVSIVLQLLLLQGESKFKKCDTACKCWRGKGKTKSTINWTAISAVAFLIAGRAIITTRTAAVETLFNPILSDSFGLTEKKSSYYFFALTVPVIVGSFAVLVMRLLKVNTRLMAIMGTTVSLLGVFIIADWQSIAHDPCTQFSLFHHPELADEYNASYSIPDSPLASIGVHSQQQGARVVIEFNAHIQQLLVFQESVYNIARNKCEEARVSKHNCHWIPSSSITKELCMDCQPICRSVDRTLTFAQFLIGAILLEFFQPIARVSVTAMLSDQVNRDFQGIVMGFASASAAALVSITPLWLDAAYEGVGKRTFLPMVIFIATNLPFTVGLIVSYSCLGQRAKDLKSNGEEEKNTILEATNEDGATELTQLMAKEE